MADANPNFAIRQFTTANGVAIPGQGGLWIPIVAPITCGQIVLQNMDQTNNCNVRSDPADPKTQKVLNAGLELTLRASQGAAWGPGMLVCYVQPVAGQGPIVGTFLR